MIIGSKQKLLFIGDSITDTGRARPVGEHNGGEGLGTGYVSLVEALLTSTYPELGIRVVNMGVSGNTVRHLRERWQTDVLDQKPDWLAVMIGINDVWRHFDRPFMREHHVHEEEYERTLRELVQEARPGLKGLVLMTPFYIEPNREEPMRAKMDRYGGIVRKIAEETGAVFVDTQAAFDKVLEHLYPGQLAWDRVHPGRAGHMVLARAFLNAVGFDWSR
ncbi:SGNH/GDSL hydrolase family protein [Paenibacillus thermoaerophilus]|uniref:SGNH/GDSL hydrolase family protein n=1 Tax=Paenibacillus thermoaerophilus TaxID=1215385 RepID=A0ABW2V321_9BACL|nr:SGNH/GDSL hydrolase family protein [Paenibacillus thermoaerophilus]TMV17458.1 GDSL family lipase [Paenibacillus thermoaerophilus]